MEVRPRAGGAILALLTALSLAGATPARAEDAATADLAKRLFAGNAAKPKNYACFVRRYDAEHLARHRLQKVSVMKLLITGERLPEDDNLHYSFRLGVNFRDRRGDFDSSGDCARLADEGAAAAGAKSAAGAPAIAFGCSVDCDGGGISVVLAKEDKAVIVKLEEIRIWNGKDFDEAAATALKGGADDRVFRLDRGNAEECASLVTDRKELAAMRHK